MGSPQKTKHDPNPSRMEDWEKMSDARDWYVILHNAVGTVSHTHSYDVNVNGRELRRHEAHAGANLHQGSCVPAKAFGVGVDLQRLVDLGAIRQATPWEEDQVLADFHKDAGKTAPNQFRDDVPARESGGDSPPRLGGKEGDKGEEKMTSGGFNQPPRGGDKK